ncbi:sugar ABC transporter permease [Fluviispira multicolorata]|uniref:Xylose transport system permease protein XylH n=1 Tax=Fluviispira multicolorata TaxID=2654512 RepID=A0A833JDL2_9BACT|nr:sugar ABC transporter permease [Fluviispira multicolorata]KAB8031948.1 sugar ABC transporter permease [Fluviispira multicolorata]
MNLLKQSSVENLNSDLKKSEFWEIILFSFKKNIRQYTMLIALFVIWLVFTFLTGSLFLSPRNLSNLFLQSSTVGVLAIGMTMILVAGHLDLSVGSVAGFIGAAAAILQVNYNWPAVPTILTALALGALIGVWQGYWVAYRKIPAFIVTLASMIAFRGAILGITDGRTIGPMSDSFKLIGQGYLPSIIFSQVTQIDSSGKIVLDELGNPVLGFTSLFSNSFTIGEQPPFNDLTILLSFICISAFIMMRIKKRNARIKYGFTVLPKSLEFVSIVLFSISIAAFFLVMAFYMGIPYAVLLVFILGIIFHIVTNNTIFGRHLYAMGGNLEAAKLSGINIKKRTLSVFILMGTLAAVAGIILTARLNAATTSAGQNFELDAISAAIIGGTSTMGGVGTIFGAIIGALVMASLDNGMSLMNIEVTWQYIVKGSILLLAVWVDIATRKKNE